MSAEAYDFEDVRPLFESEGSKVERWRLHILLEADYPLPLAERIAASSVDLHQAVALIRNGCAPATAAAILL